MPNIRLHYGDGRLGLAAAAPFDAIVIAAAGLDIPQALLEQLRIGGRLVAPVGGQGGNEQVLTLVERVASRQWRETLLDRVFFRPLEIRSDLIPMSMLLRVSAKICPMVVRRSVCALAVLTLAACATRMDQAPVVDRSGNFIGTEGSSANVAAAGPLAPAPPGYYRVKPGDTLYRIALENGVNYRDIANWNNVTNPNQIEVDQLLRIAPPGTDAAANAANTPGVSTAPIGGAGVQAMPLGGGAPSGPGGMPPYGSNSPYATNGSNGANGPNGSSGPTGGQGPNLGGGNSPYGAPPGVTGVPAAPASAVPSDGAVNFSWPVRGPVLNGFDDAKNKGIDIGGTPGTPILAAADGRVVYAGNGLRGYGNLIIIKHNATFLTAYAHNQALLVKEGDAVTKGQKIAEMGNSDSNRVMLHFEVRRQGKPVDPMKYLSQ